MIRIILICPVCGSHNLKKVCYFDDVKQIICMNCDYHFKFNEGKIKEITFEVKSEIKEKEYQ